MVGCSNSLMISMVRITYGHLRAKEIRKVETSLSFGIGLFEASDEPCCYVTEDQSVYKDGSTHVEND